MRFLKIANLLKNPKLLLKIFLISLIFNGLVVLFFIGKRIYYSSHAFSYRQPGPLQPVKNDSLLTYTINIVTMNRNKKNLFLTLKHDTTDIVFLGNSLIEGFPLQEMFQTLKVKNRGIGGNTTKDIIVRLNEVTDGRPNKIFLEIGINDIWKGIPIDSIFGNFKMIAELIKQNSPSTKLFVQSVFPTTFNTKYLIPQIERYNKAVEFYCSANNISFINLYPAFCQNGELRASLTTDGVHLTEKGYFLWKKQIEKFVTN